MRHAAVAPCPYCDQEGFIRTTETCPRCQGRGRIASAFAVHMCTKCLGTGIIQTVLVCSHCYSKQDQGAVAEALDPQAPLRSASAGSAERI